MGILTRVLDRWFQDYWHVWTTEVITQLGRIHSKLVMLETLIESPADDEED